VDYTYHISSYQVFVFVVLQGGSWLLGHVLTREGGEGELLRSRGAVEWPVTGCQGRPVGDYLNLIILQAGGELPRTGGVCAAVTGRRLRWPAGNSTEAQGYSPEVRGFYPLGPRAAFQHTIISASALGAS
jgi:hypothetical protein